MNTSVAITGSGAGFRDALHASFAGMLRSEFLKISRLFWFMLTILNGGTLFSFLIGANLRGVRGDLQHTPLHFLYYSLESNLVIFRLIHCTRGVSSVYRE